VLASPETMTALVHAGGAELLQISQSTNEDMHSKLVMWLL